MTQALHKSTQDLINTIERKDRIFRITQGIFMSLLIVVLIGVILLQSRTINAVQKQQAQQKEATATIDRHLDCIVVYFQQANRAQLKIDDINKCTLSNGTSVQQFFSEPVNSAGGPQSSAITPGNNQSNTDQQKTSPTGNPGNPPTTPSSPLTVLGVPVCVPLTSMCLRH